MPGIEQQEPKHNQPNGTLEQIEETLRDNNLSGEEKDVKFSEIIRKAMQEIDEWGKQEIKKHEKEFKKKLEELGGNG